MGRPRTARRSPRKGRPPDMNRSLKIFVSIFCYISAVVGLGLAVINASLKPAAVTPAVVFGSLGAVFLLAGMMLTRMPRR